MKYEYSIRSIFNKKKAKFYLQSYLKKKIKIIKNSAKQSKLVFFLQTINFIFALYIIYLLFPQFVNKIINYISGVNLGLASSVILVIFTKFVYSILPDTAKKLKIGLMSLYKTDRNLTLLLTLIALVFVWSYYNLPTKVKMFIESRNKK